MKKSLSFILTLLLLLTNLTAFFTLDGAAITSTKVYLSDLTPIAVTTGYGEAHYNENLEGGALSLANDGNKLTFGKGICVHAESEISFDISGYNLPLFRAMIGMDDGSYGYKDYAGASFEVWADGVKLKDYGTLRINDAAVEVSIALPENTKILTLKNGHGNDGSTWSEHCNWCDAMLMSDPSALSEVSVSLGEAILTVGGTTKVSYTAFTASGEQIAEGLSVRYSSSNSSAATVSGAGVVTAKGAGSAEIEVSVTKDGVTVKEQTTIKVVREEAADTHLLSSPGKNLQILLENGDGKLRYSVYKNGKKVIEPSLIGYTTAEADFTSGFAFSEKSPVREINDTYKNYSGDYAYGVDHCNEQSFTFSKGDYRYTVILRAYDDGYALRSRIERADGKNGKLTVTDDKTAVKLPDGALIWGSQIDKPDILKGNSYETGFPTIKIENTYDKYILKAPIAKLSDDIWVLLSEADLYSEDTYIGSIFKGIGDNTLEYTAGPQKTTEDGVTTNAFLDNASAAELNKRLAAIEVVEISLDPSFTFPWRFGTVGDLKEIVESDLVDNLNPPAEGDFSWVEPGYTAWMWLSEGFSGQRNEETIREYIDLASSLGWKYLILDEGWQPNSKVPGKSYDGYFDYFDDLLAYAEEKGVAFIAWVKLYDLNTPEKREILAEWAQKGIKGIKFDFVESEGIDRMENVRAIYEKCAECHMLVNEHGGNIPTGERRTWPNVINRESVKGQEYGGVWCTDTTVMPYTRSAMGPTDITPKLEATGSNTAAHQLALNIVIESGMPCMASDTEVYYTSNAKYILSHLPAFFDDLYFIDGYPGDYTVLARKKGDNWFVGGIAVSAKNISFSYDFLEEGKEYTALIYRDGSTRDQILLEKKVIRLGDEMTIPTLAGGGFSVMLMPEGSFIEAKELSVKENILMLEEGTTGQIEVVLAPQSADAVEISSVSDNPSVATVNAKGVVTAKSEGIAHITLRLPSASLETTVEVRVYAGMGYELSSDWTIVNPDSTQTVKAGNDEESIRMPILGGDTTGVPRNMYLIDAPKGDFTLTVKVSGGLSSNYDSLGLIAYGGSGNMVVMNRRYHSYLGGNIFCLSNYDGDYIERTAPDTSKNADAWLKLVKKGDVFTGYYSYDGVTYEQMPETITQSKVSGAADLKIGVCGIHGNTPVTTLVTGTLSHFTLNGKVVPFCVPENGRVISIRRMSSMQLVPTVLRTVDSYADLTFTVADESIASVNEQGILTAYKNGVTTLKITNKQTGRVERDEVRVYSIAGEGYGEFVLVNPNSGKMPVNSTNDPYTLTMPTLTGDINALPQNLVLTGAPAGDFTLTVKVSGGLNKDFQSIGLVIFNDSGSMVTMERRSHSYFGGNVFCASTSINGSYTENRTSDATPGTEAYLKLEKIGNTFKGYFSFDGSKWSAVDAITNAEVGSSGKLQVGLIARTGSYSAETTATYKNFAINGKAIPFVATEEAVQLILPDALCLNCGTPLPSLPDKLELYYNSGKTESVNVVWTTSSFDSSRPGWYILRAVDEKSGITADYTVYVSLYGDLNADEKVNISDVTALLDYLSGREDALDETSVSDLTGDGMTNISDVTALLNHLSKNNF